MVCPYCSTDMEPIELNGKVFCSNCGLTIKGGMPTEPTNQISQSPQTVANVNTEAPEEVQFPVVKPQPIEASEELIPNKEETLETPDLTTEVVETSKMPDLDPITAEAKQDMGLLPESESRIPDIQIPSESDFETKEPEIQPETQTMAGSSIELPVFDEKDALDASSILLDILAEDKKGEVAKSEEPVSDDVEKPASNEAEKPKSVKLKVKTEEKPMEEPAIEAVQPSSEGAEPQPVSEPEIDPKTEQKIEKLEEKIEAMPEPEIQITPEEAKEYDPDTIKTQAIKEYFSSALSETRNQPHKEAKKTKGKKKTLKKGPHLIFAFTLFFIIIGLIGFLLYYLVQSVGGL